ncbi:MAG: hypothetical protein WCO95_02660, partial [Actinomycetes bacterium]
PRLASSAPTSKVETVHPHGLGCTLIVDEYAQLEEITHLQSWGLALVVHTFASEKISAQKRRACISHLRL